MRQEIADLVHQIDAQVLVIDADMDVHAADHQAPSQGLHVLGQFVVALFVGVELLVRGGKRVRGGGDHAEIVFVRQLDDGRTQVVEIGPGLGDGATDPGPHFDLRTQKFRAHLLFKFADAVLHQGGRRVGRQIPAFAVDQQVFFVDADSERWILERHGLPPFSRWSGFRFSGNASSNIFHATQCAYGPQCLNQSLKHPSG